MSSVPSPAAVPEGAVRLSDWGVIRASGEDAARFLHGQLTQDIEHLTADQGRLAGYCSAKGRLLASFVVWRREPQELLLACSADLLATVLKRLTMYVLRARCKLGDASGEFPLWGLAGGAVAALAPTPDWGRTTRGAADLIRLPAAAVGGTAWPRALCAGDPPAGLQPLDPQAWNWLEVHSAVARVVAATAERFVPQMVNLELTGGIDFGKGCYPGQEVVARSQYRGTLKRRAYVVASAAPLHPGQEVFHSADAGQPAGQVVLAGSWAGHDAGLVELKISALADGSLHAGTVDGPLLTPATPPYPIPAEAA